MSQDVVTVEDLTKRTRVILPAGTGYFQAAHWSLTGTLEADTVATARILSYGHPNNHLRQITFSVEGLDVAINVLLGRDVELVLA